MYLKNSGRSELRLQLNCNARWKAMSTLLAPFLSLGGRACMCHSSHFLSSLPLRNCASAELTLFTHSSFLDPSSFPSQFFYHLGGKDSCDHFFILPLFYLWDKQWFRSWRVNKRAVLVICLPYLYLEMKFSVLIEQCHWPLTVVNAPFFPETHHKSSSLSPFCI